MRILAKQRELGLCLVLAGLVSAAVSCAKSAPVQPAPAETRPTVDVIAQADRLYAQRDDLARVREGLALLRNARAADYSNYDVAWRLAKFNYHLGHHTTNEEEKDQAFREGIEAGEAAVRLQPEKPDGHFWLGANLGGRAQTSTLSGLASADDIRKEMEAVLRLDEGYQVGSAYMVLGQVDLELPKMLGGDPKRAVEYLEKGLRFGETNVLLRLQLAKAYLAVKRDKEARQQLQTILSMKPDPDYVPEYKEAAAEAQKLLDKGASEKH
ncbi:MAG TPA: TRAP transporter TatT component family protein [Pyrinomonadaceae bacterium]|nr:TRAP transporter TatT component family protein [Pyrinomonadaceae bacterium]